MSKQPNKSAHISTIEKLPNASVETRSIESAYNARLAAQTIIKQLMHLCRDIQKHRGLGMGILAGNQNFVPQLTTLQQQMSRRIELLFHFSQAGHSQISTIDINKIHEAWKTIHEGWHDDSVMENFQFHCYFVEQILQLVISISHQLESPVYQAANTRSASTDILNTQDKPKATHSLLQFVCIHLPKMIEFLGMVRALSTHATTLGHHIEEHDKKLKYLCQCALTEKLNVIQLAETLHQQIGNRIPSLLTLKTYEFKLDALIEYVMKHVIAQANIPVTNVDVFSMATEIIDIYWRVVDNVLDIIHQDQEQELENWCLNH